MMRIGKRLWGMMWVLLASAVLAAGRDYGEAFTALPAVRIAPSESGQAFAAVQLPAVARRPGFTAVLAFRVRAAHTTPRGWSHLMSLELNGKAVTPARFSGEVRLLFRGERMVDNYSSDPAKNQTEWWRNGRLLVFYSPEVGARLDPHATTALEEGLDYYLDAGDLLRADGENTLRLGYYLKRGALKNNPELLVERLRVVYVPDAELRKAQLRLKPGRQKDTAGRSFENAFVFNQALEIPPAPSGIASAACELPAVPARGGYVPVLRFDARIRNSALSGWHHYFFLKVNGVRLEKQMPSGAQRLLYRGETVSSTYESWSAAKGREWWGSGMLLAFFAPPSATLPDPHLLSARDEGFVYYLDISDCVHLSRIGADDRLEGGEPNLVEFGYSPAAGMIAKGMPLLLKDINIVYIPEAEMRKARPAIPLTRREQGEAAARLSFAGGTLQVNTTGGLEIAVGQDRFFVETRVSYAARPAMKFNRLAASKLEGEVGWKPEVRQVSADEAVVTAQGRDYAFRRRILRDGHRFRVVDTIANAGKGEIGLAVFEELSANQPARSDYRLAGLANARGAGYDAGVNPTVYAPGEHGAAVGLLVEDTLSRCKLEMGARANLLSVGIPAVGLPPGETLVREWAIYPRPENRGYYDFINQVRRDWKVNITVPGPSVSAEHAIPPATLKPAFLQVRPWFEYATGAGLSRDEFLAEVKPRMAALRKAYPGVVILASLETNLVPLDCTNLPWKDELPLTYGDRTNENSQYGIYASAEATRKLDALTPLRDSILRSADGRALLDTYFIYKKQALVNLMVQPDGGNARERQIHEQIDFCVDVAGFDGIYLDQFPPKPREGYSLDRWDGRSVTLNPDGTIATKFYSYAYKGVGARVRIIEKVRSKGVMFRCNGSPVSREEQGLGIVSFHEQENTRFDPMLFLDEKPPETISQVSAHLAPSPAVVILRPGRYTRDFALFPRLVTKGIILALRNGVLPYYYNVGPESAKVDCTLGNHCFPFTTVELHEGWLVGKERTITAVSGEYAVAGTRRPAVFSFDRNGYPKEATGVAITGGPGKWRAKVQLDDWNEVTILEVRD